MDSKLHNFNWLAWFVSIGSGFLLMASEVLDFGAYSENLFLICAVTIAASVLFIFFLSVYNFILDPPNRIFITYEKFLRLSLDDYFAELNKISKG